MLGGNAIFSRSDFYKFNKLSPYWIHMRFFGTKFSFCVCNFAKSAIKRERSGKINTDSLWKSKRFAQPLIVLRMRIPPCPLIFETLL